VPGDHVADEHGRGEQDRVDREWISVPHAHGRRIEHQIATGRARRPGDHAAVAEVCEQVEERSHPRLVGIVDDEHADGRRQKLDGDRAACSPRSDKKR
jgi:hypothetical protein